MSSKRERPSLSIDSNNNNNTNSIYQILKHRLLLTKGIEESDNNNKKNENIDEFENVRKKKENYDDDDNSLSSTTISITSSSSSIEPYFSPSNKGKEVNKKEKKKGVKKKKKKENDDDSIVVEILSSRSISASKSPSTSAKKKRKKKEGDDNNSNNTKKKKVLSLSSSSNSPICAKRKKEKKVKKKKRTKENDDDDDLLLLEISSSTSLSSRTISTTSPSSQSVTKNKRNRVKEEIEENDDDDRKKKKKKITVEISSSVKREQNGTHSPTNDSVSRRLPSSRKASIPSRYVEGFLGVEMSSAVIRSTTKPTGLEDRKRWKKHRSRIGSEYQVSSLPVAGNHQYESDDNTKLYDLVWDPERAGGLGNAIHDHVAPNKKESAVSLLHECEYNTKAFYRDVQDKATASDGSDWSEEEMKTFGTLLTETKNKFNEVAKRMEKTVGECMCYYLNHYEVVRTTTRSQSARGGANTSNNTRTIRCDIWDLYYNELLGFKKVQGHCLVPKVYPMNQSLSTWVYRQRAEYKLWKRKKRSQLTDERVDLLKECGFAFYTKGTEEQKKIESQRRQPSLDAHWQRHYKSLLEFREEHGHCIVPKMYPENQALSAWVFRQRREYKLSALGKMTEERLQKLREVDFIFEVKCTDTFKELENQKRKAMADVRWYEMYRQLLTYRKRTGHTVVPKVYKPNKQLASWVYRQRADYRRRNQGEVSNLDDDRLKKLLKIGFVFQVRKKK